MAKKILVIDDDHMVAKTLEKLLSREGFNVIIAESGEVALGIISDEKIDLIISDVRMPNMNGVETIKAINARLKEFNQYVPPVIFITGYAESQINASAKELNPKELLYKPFDKDEFLRTVHLALNE